MTALHRGAKRNSPLCGKCPTLTLRLGHFPPYPGFTLTSPSDFPLTDKELQPAAPGPARHETCPAKSVSV